MRHEDAAGRDADALRPIDPTSRQMRSYRATLGAGIGCLHVETDDRPVPGRFEVVVRVRAVSLSYREFDDPAWLVSPAGESRRDPCF